MVRLLTRKVKLMKGKPFISSQNDLPWKTYISAQEFVEILNGTRNKILLIIRCGVARPLLKFICLFKELMRSLKNYF